MLQKRILIAAAIAALGCCGSAVADVRLFVTSSADGYGLDLIGPDGDGTGTDPEHDDWPIDPFRPTYSTVTYDQGDVYGVDHYYAYYRAAAYPPIDAPSGTIDNPILIDASAGDWGYLWFQFRNEFDGATLNALVTRISEAGSTEPATEVTPTYYVQNNMDAYSTKRWDGVALPENGYADWHQNPQDMLAVTLASGIKNRFDDPENLFENQEINGSMKTGVALLGAIQADASDEIYEITIDEFGYTHGPFPDIGASCFFKFVPEPAAAWLLATIVLSTRRRS